jgi:hypothetical protein
MKYIKQFENAKLIETMIPHEDGTGLLINFGQYGNFEEVIEYLPALQGYREAGYSDWRIPNKDELFWIYENLDSTKISRRLTYWSSSTSSFVGDNTYYCLSFNSGKSLYCNRYDSNWAMYVRDITEEEVDEYIMNKNAEKYNL